MTNTEYEAASISAAGCCDRVEGEHKLKQLDERIAALEAALAKAHEARREIVNLYNLNKCSHTWVDVTALGDVSQRWYCPECGAREEGEDNGYQGH